ncbi:MAG: hypothetical protein RLN81_02135 [Balneolaceae bacterium]
MKHIALFVAAYLIALPILNAFHFSEHHHHHLDAEIGQSLISETVPDCDLCFVYQNQKLVNSEVENISLAVTFSPFPEIPTATLVSNSSDYISLRAPPSLAV